MPFGKGLIIPPPENNFVVELVLVDVAVGAGCQGQLPDPHPVVLEDDVWVGPNAVILKGVRVGTGSWIEAGSLVGGIFRDSTRPA